MKDSIYMKMGNQSLEAGKLFAAYGYFREELRAHPNNINALFKIGIVKFHMQEFAIALNYFNKVLERNPDHKQAREQIRQIHSIVHIESTSGEENKRS